MQKKQVKNLATFKENSRCGKVDVKKYMKNLATFKENRRCGKVGTIKQTENLATLHKFSGSGKVRRCSGSKRERASEHALAAGPEAPPRPAGPEPPTRNYGIKTEAAVTDK